MRADNQTRGTRWRRWAGVGPRGPNEQPSSVLPPPASRLSPSKPRARHAHAFSLVELLAVVAIIAIVSVAAVPIMRGLGGSQSSRATAQTLLSALEQARTAAILTGTDVWLLVLRSSNSPPRIYGLVRRPVDLDANGQDDFLSSTNPTNWLVLSKWEKLPGDLIFSTNSLTNVPSQGLALPPNAAMVGGIGFSPSGGFLNRPDSRGLLFASSNKVSNNRATVADKIALAFFSGRVRYAGITNNTDF